MVCTYLNLPLGILCGAGDLALNKVYLSAVKKGEGQTGTR